MKKNDLIKLLQSIEGNPNILIYNGFVEDYQDLDKEYIEDTLYKYDKTFIRNIINMERTHHGVLSNISDKEFDIRWKKEDWDFKNEFFGEENIKTRYGKNKKKVVLFNLKSRNKKVWDRMGSIEY